MGSYVPSTPAQRREMLEAVGCASMEDLFGHLPRQILLDRPLHLPSGLSELEVRRTVEKMAAHNTVFSTVLRGAGAYRHYIPAINCRSASNDFSGAMVQKSRYCNE